MNEAAPVGKDEGGRNTRRQVSHNQEGTRPVTQAVQPVQWTRATTRVELLNLARLVAAGEEGAAATARSVVPLIAAECCPNALRVFFDRLVPAIRDNRTGSADVALEELLGGEAA